MGKESEKEWIYVWWWFSYLVVSDSLRPHGLYPARLLCLWAFPELIQTHVHWVGDAIQPSCPLSSPSPPAFSLSQSFPVSQLFSSGGRSIGASALATVLPMNIQGWFPLALIGWSPYSPRDSQESPSTPQFKGSSSSVLSLLYGTTLTSIHDHL